MNNKIKILHLEDSINDSDLIRSLIDKGGIEYDYFLADNKKGYLKILETEKIDIILCDYKLPDYNGNEALKIAREKYSQIPFIFVSGTMGEDSAIESMVNGATDYVLKNKLERLVPAINRAIREREIARKRKKAEEKLQESNQLMSMFVKHSPIYAFIKDVSPDESRVLIASDNIHDLTGIAASDMVGKNMYELFPAGFAEKITHDDWQVVSDGKILQLNEELNNRNYITFKFPILLGGKTKLAGYTIDITERKQAEEALREHEQMISTIVESSQDWIWAIDRNGRHTYSNRAVESILGYSPAEFQGLGLDLVHPDDKPLVETEWPVWVEERRGWRNKVLRWRAKDGTYRQLESTAMPILDPRGELLGFRGVDRDITDRKQAEEEIRISENKFRTITEQTSDLIAITDTNGIVTYASLSSKTLFQFDPEEMCGHNFMEFLIEPEIPKALAAFSDLIKGGNRTLDLELTMKRKDGSTFIGELNGSKFQQGMIIGTLVGIRDITERRRAEEALKENNYRLNLAMQSAKMAWWEMDITTGNVTFEKRKAEMLGYAPEKFNHYKDFVALLHPDDNEKAMDAMRKHIDGSLEKYEVEYRILNNSGEYKWFYDIGAIVKRDSTGKPLNVTGLVIDISERKKGEKVLEEIISKNPMSIQIVDKNGYTLSVNSSHTKLFGSVPPPDFTIFNDSQLEKQGFKELFERVKKGEIVHFPDTYFNAHDFNPQFPDIPVWVRGVVFPLMDSSGNPERFVLMQNDITEQKKAEEALQVSEARFRFVIQSVPNVAVQGYGPDGTTQYWNQASERLYGYTTQEAIGRNLVELIIPPEMRGDVKQAIQQMVETRQPIPASELFLMRKDGSRVPVFSSHVIIQVPGREPELFCIDIDLTERKRAEEALKESEERFKLVIEASEQGIWDWNVETNEIYYSPQWKKQIGYEDHELKNEFDTWTQQLHPDEKETCLNAVMEYLAHPIEYFILEFRFRHKDGSYRIIHNNASSVKNEQGKVIRMFGMHTDITERKKAEESLKKSQLLLKSSIESPKDMIILSIDKQYKYLYFNTFHKDGMVSAYGKNVKLGMNILDCITNEDDRRKAKINYDRALNGESHIKVEEFGDLDRYYYETRYNPIINDKNEVIGATAFSANITERIQVEKAMEESERRLSTLVGNLPGFAYRCKNDKDWTMTFISEGCKKITGYTPEDFINNKTISYNDIILPEYQDYLWEKRQKLLKDKQTFIDEYKIITASGEIRWVWERGNGIFDEKGKLQYLEGYIEDVTERKQVEAQLYLQSLVLNQIQDRVTVTDLEGKITYVNNAEVKMLGYSREELIGSTVKKYGDDPKKGATQQEILEETLKHGEWRGEVVNKSTDGKEIILDSRTQIVFDEQGNRVALAGIATDITERKQAEKALKESEGKYKNLIETMPEGFYRSTPEGYFVDVNPAIVKMLGFESKEELLKIYIPDELYFSRDERIDGVNYNIDFIPDTEIYRLKKKDGSEIWVEDHSRYIQDSYGKILYHEGIMRDITVSLQAQKAMVEAKEKAEEVSRLKTSFLANMSHEIRTPLNGILGFSEILKNELKDPMHKKFADIIEKSGNRLLETLDLILSFSKLEAEKEDVHYSNVRIENVIDEVLNSFEAIAKNKNLFLKQVIKNEKLITNIDERFLRQIMNNLINNAIKYTEAGGITVTLSKDNSNVVINVKDTGIGIAEDKHKIIFEEFRQESEGHGRSFEGTGLGLAITKRFVELMKGTIEVESEAGVGSIFTVKFPYEKAPETITIKMKKEEQKKEIMTKPPDKDKLSVLLVENDLANLDFTVTILEEYYNIETAVDGPEAIEKVNNKVYDIILMDINLGKGMDGIEVVRKIRELSGYAKTPIVALTAFTLPGDREEFLAGGCTHYLGKPFTKNQILELLGKIKV